MSSTTRATTGEGVQVPEGKSLAVSPVIRKQGKKATPPQGFKSRYAASEVAPVAVLTTPPKILKQVNVEYPEKMKELGIEGRVALELIIDVHGKVVEVKVLNGLRTELDEVAIAAARRLIFVPATMNGNPVRVKIPYTFTFVLD